MKIQLRTQKFYNPGPCTVYWTDEDWERSATYRTEPKKITFMGYIWRTLGERNATGDLLYLRAEKTTD